MRNISKIRGFTLLELMIAVAIVAILATMAVGSYRQYLYRTNRAEAKMALLQIQTAQEKYFLQNNKYVSTTAVMSASLASGGLGIPGTTPNGAYKITLDGSSSDSNFLAIADALGKQLTDDANCPQFTIDQTGSRTPADSTGCWK